MKAIARDFDANMLTIFTPLGFDAEARRIVLDIAVAEDIGRMDDAAIVANPHVHGRDISKWRDILSPGQLREIERLYGDVLLRLDYGLSAASSETAARTA